MSDCTSVSGRVEFCSASKHPWIGQQRNMTGLIQEYFTMTEACTRWWLRFRYWDTEESSDEEKEPPSIIMDTVQEVVDYEEVLCTYMIQMLNWKKLEIAGECFKIPIIRSVRPPPPRHSYLSPSIVGKWSRPPLLYSIYRRRILCLHP